MSHDDGQPPTRPPKPASTAGLRILICEDDPLAAMGFAEILRNAGWQVVGPAHTAVEALAESYLRLPDLALIDIGLKGMIDGISVAAELAPLGVPVIFLTGDYQRAGQRRQGTRDGYPDQAGFGKSDPSRRCGGAPSGSGLIAKIRFL